MLLSNLHTHTVLHTIPKTNSQSTQSNNKYAQLVFVLFQFDFDPIQFKSFSIYFIITSRSDRASNGNGF